MLRHNYRTAVSKTRSVGITLVEVLVALAIASIVAVPAFYLYQRGLKSSVTGVISLDMLAEGRRIVTQLRDDLKNSCIPYHGAFSLSFNDMLNASTGGAGTITGVEYALYRFAREPVLTSKAFLPTARLLRPLISVRYNLERNSGSDLFKLVRIETASGAPDRVKVMSERVNFMRIVPVKVAGSDNIEGWLWNVSLQLAHLGDNGRREFLESSNRGQGAVSMDFYDVVDSSFFTAICRNPLATRNWNGGLTYTPN